MMTNDDQQIYINTKICTILHMYIDCQYIFYHHIWPGGFICNQYLCQQSASLPSVTYLYTSVLFKTFCVMLCSFCFRRSIFWSLFWPAWTWGHSNAPMRACRCHEFQRWRPQTLAGNQWAKAGWRSCYSICGKYAEQFRRGGMGNSSRACPKWKGYMRKEGVSLQADCLCPQVRPRRLRPSPPPSSRTI